MRILVVEDDDLIARGIAAGLRAYGFTADTVRSAAQAELALANAECDAMVLDRGSRTATGFRCSPACVEPEAPCRCCC